MDRINFHPVNPVILSKNASEYSLITNYVHRIGVKTKCIPNFQTGSYTLDFSEAESMVVVIAADDKGLCAGNS